MCYDSSISKYTGGGITGIEKLVGKLTTEEKVALVAGTDFMYTNPVPRLDIPSLSMADGPHGLRKQKNADGLGVTRSEPSTSFPTAATTASSWEPENTRKMGAAIAEECRHYGVHVLLGLHCICAPVKAPKLPKEINTKKG